MTRIVGPLWKAIDDYVESLGDVTLPIGTKLLLPRDGNPANAPLVFGSSGVSIYGITDIALGIAIGNSLNFKFEEGSFHAFPGYGGVMSALATSTNPCLVPHVGDSETGIGRAGSYQLSLIANGKEGVRTSNVSGNIQNNQKGIMIHGQTPQVLTGAGAVDVTSAITYLVTTGSNAMTLADGAEGQMKTIIMKTDGGNATVTPANFSRTSIIFDNVGETVTLMFTDGKWQGISYFGVSITG